MVTLGLAGVTTVSWIYTSYLAGGLEGAMLAMPRMHRWEASYLTLVFVMWAVMMVGMMVPSASPLVLLFVRMNRTRHEEQDPLLPTAAFLAGYVAAWSAYGAAATLVQWGLHRAALLSPTAVSASPVLGGALLVAAGLYQWTPLKRACLTECRSPLGFLMSEWRDGGWGAFVMGAKHGWFCVGCCWVLMALLFVAGVMNLLWMAAITLFVLAEKVLPGGELVARAGGTAFVVAGIALLALG